MKMPVTVSRVWVGGYTHVLSQICWADFTMNTLLVMLVCQVGIYDGSIVRNMKSKFCGVALRSWLIRLGFSFMIKSQQFQTEIFLLFPPFLHHLWLFQLLFLFSSPKFCAYCFFLGLTFTLLSSSGNTFPVHPTRYKLSPHFSVKLSQLFHPVMISPLFEFLDLELDSTLNTFPCNCLTSVCFTFQSTSKTFGPETVLYKATALHVNI